MIAALLLSVAASPGCFEIHLRESIALNASRLRAYAAASDGASTEISVRMIAGEVALLPVAIALDRIARHERGARGLCDVFPPSAPSRSSSEGGHRGSARRRGSPGQAPSQEVDTTPSRGCMVRHAEESLRRIEAIAAHDDAPVLRAVARLHTAGLVVLADLDDDAAPVQTRGVPIICADVPATRAWENGLDAP